MPGGLQIRPYLILRTIHEVDGGIFLILTGKRAEVDGGIFLILTGKRAGSEQFSNYPRDRLVSNKSGFLPSVFSS